MHRRDTEECTGTLSLSRVEARLEAHEGVWPRGYCGFDAVAILHACASRRLPQRREHNRVKRRVMRALTCRTAREAGEKARRRRAIRLAVYIAAGTRAQGNPISPTFTLPLHLRLLQLPTFQHLSSFHPPPLPPRCRPPRPPRSPRTRRLTLPQAGRTSSTVCTASRTARTSSPCPPRATRHPQRADACHPRRRPARQPKSTERRALSTRLFAPAQRRGLLPYASRLGSLLKNSLLAVRRFLPSRLSQYAPTPLTFAHVFAYLSLIDSRFLRRSPVAHPHTHTQKLSHPSTPRVFAYLPPRRPAARVSTSPPIIRHPLLPLVSPSKKSYVVLDSLMGNSFSFTRPIVRPHHRVQAMDVMHLPLKRLPQPHKKLATRRRRVGCSALNS
ncbi:hypothetical protein EXIGLDRAFT_458529 [Exidia glandulosa HHB12029]|uniref:Uncharacterized protein n=1 Tax=Exidia glandulosa HHB12029 TaxID=1314781 RepID=A0A166BMK6_EXIGL|nr:hypothetical protein EXIGLDRAFT_458529 [Exidia glandulosa HHB12029]